MSALKPLEFPLRGSRLIEASAGTGKTWTLAALYVRLILGHGGEAAAFARPLLPPEILVVTFTEAATQELRDRIRQRLSEAARGFRGLGQADGFLQGLIDSHGEAERAACARRLEVAAQWMDEAAVYTIHGWCNRMLRQHAFDSGSLFKLEIETADAELLLEAARDYWRCFFYPLDEAESLAVAKLADSPRTLLGQVQALLKETEAQWRDGGKELGEPAPPHALLRQWADWDAQRQALEDAARRSWAGDRAALEALLLHASGQGWLDGRSYPPAGLRKRLDALADWADGGDCPEKWLEGFAQSRIKLTKKHQDKAPGHPAFAALDAWLEQRAGEPDFRREILAHAARWIQARFAEEKQQRARMGFDDLLARLDQALRRPAGPRLAEAIRAQYPIALVDEFQDTDPVQYRIFDAVYQTRENREAQGFFMIGDPKQAIYSFRGADIFTYLKARAATEGRHYSLATNYRSTAPLVEAVNRFFGHAEAQPGGAFKFKAQGGENPLPFQPITPQGRAGQWQIEGRPAPAMTLWHLQPEDGVCAMGEYRRVMAGACASAITALLNQAAQGQAGFQSAPGFRPLRPADLAILVRDRNEAAAIRQALAARKVRSVYLSGRESVYDTPEAADLLHWLRACAEPALDRLLRAALGTATLDLSYAELETLNNDESRWEAEVERFRGYRKIWRLQGVLPMLRRLLADFGVPARLLPLPDGERRLTNLLHLAELLQTASADLDGEQALIRHLAEARDGAAQSADEALLRLESDADLIKVVTIHKSKGLEYPLVFLPFICSFKETSSKQAYYRYHDEAGRLQVDLAKSDGAKPLAERERLQEDLRLLYVALTRATHACWLGIAPVKSGNGKDCQLDKTAIGHVLAGGEPVPAEDLGRLLRALQGGCAAIHIAPPPDSRPAAYTPAADRLELEPARRFSGRAAEHWWIASYSALPVAEEGVAEAPARPAEAPDTPRQANLEEPDEAESPPVPTGGAWTMHRFPRGAKPGTFLHGLLEWAAREGFSRVAGQAGPRKDAIARRCHTRGWVAWLNPLDDWLAQLLAQPMALPEGPLALCELRTYQPELEFWFASGKVDALALDALVSRHTLAAAPRPPLLPTRLHGMFKGFIDLVFEHQGRYYVVDYKSNWLGADDDAYTAEAMRGAVLDKRYELQYALYLLALHRQLKVRLGKAYDYDRHIGGAAYLFLRGLDGPAGGLHFEKPPKALIEAMDALFKGRREAADVA
jgi:exodeoxyribonuclease V beta subunit